MGNENTNPPEQNPDEAISRYLQNLGRGSDFDRLEDEIAAYQAQHPEEYEDSEEHVKEETEQGSAD